MAHYLDAGCIQAIICVANGIVHTESFTIMKQYQEEFHQSEQLKFEASTNIMFRELDDESVLLNLNDESYYSLNNTGTVIWNLLQTCPSVKEAFLSFKNQFKIEDDQASKDFKNLLKQLLEKQFGTLKDTKDQ